MKRSSVSTPCRACGREMFKYPATPFVSPEYKGQKTYPFEFIDYETMEIIEKYLSPEKFNQLKEQYEEHLNRMAAIEIEFEKWRENKV